jgi:hypothetical protein
MTILMIFALAAAAAGAVIWLRRTTATVEQAAAPQVAPPRNVLRPTQHIDTQKLRAVTMHTTTRVWEFCAPEGACEMGRRAHGRRIEVDTGTELPSHRCGMVECHCHYRPVADHRAAERRSGDERREALRFEDNEDRRRGRLPRRHLNTWTDTPSR